MTRGGLHTPHSLVAGLALAALAACSGPPDTPATSGLRAFVDAAGDTLRLDAPPSRIVSLVPSVTQTIYRLGEGDRLVGRTVYDTASALAHLPSVGAGMGPDYEMLLGLQADLVVYFVGASDPDTPAQLRRLGLRGFGVRPDVIEDVTALYTTFGSILQTEARGDELASGLRATLDSVRAAVSGRESIGVSYLLDGDPPWTAGPSTYIGQLVELAGGDLLPDDLPPMYAQVSPEGLVSADIDVILISGTSNLDARLSAGRRVERIPGWVEVPGPELREAAWMIAYAIHPDLAPAPPAPQTP